MNFNSVNTRAAFDPAFDVAFEFGRDRYHFVLGFPEFARIRSD